MVKPALRAFLCLSLAALDAQAALAGTLRVAVGEVRNNRGRIHVDICSQAQFLKDCSYSAEAPARMGVTIVTLPNLPPGRYAAQVFHDENGNQKVDQLLFGIPKEGVGFSNDARIKLRPPRFDDAVFGFNGADETISLRLRYFLGARPRR